MSETLTLVSCKNARQAAAIARALVREKLAACVSVVPKITSIFRWEGRVQEANEVLLLIKSRRPLSRKLASRVQALHSYEVPEVVTIPITGGNPAYLRWIRQSTR